MKIETLSSAWLFVFGLGSAAKKREGRYTTPNVRSSIGSIQKVVNSFFIAVSGITLAFLFCTYGPAPCFAAARTLDDVSRFAETERPIFNFTTVQIPLVSGDYANFYSGDRLLGMSAWFIAGGVAANSSIDSDIQRRYQEKVRSEETDALAAIAKSFGEGTILLPATLLSSALFPSNSAIGAWGTNASRAYVVGGPALFLMQRTTGSSRPDEGSFGSEWRPTGDSNGVSGHAFVGAVPFLTIAYQNKNNPAIKYLAYFLSGLTAWSRVNDNAHYFSQVVLGWTMANQSVSAVFENRNFRLGTKPTKFHPFPMPDGLGVMASSNW